ncbi:lactonase family protein [Sphingomonas montana]|uniref:lactonase family protein n=1 Tax=Sphingomonas montana TaxID=1843236 RepID=UPI00096E6EDA|nr:lactonase family protein [Sphingomonas montana]
MRPTIHVGTAARNGGAGLHPLRLSPDAQWVGGDAFADARNASFAAYAARHDRYYLVDEQSDGAVGTFRLGTDGWQAVARTATQGAEPCYVALNPDETRLAIANYGSGSIAIFGLDDASGVPVDPPAIRPNSGSGPIGDRQDGPHAHCVCFGPDGRWLFHVDLGTDEILAYAADDGPDLIGERQVAFAAPPGSGPRHLVFHPTLPFAVLASELASTLTVLRVDGGKLTALHRISTLPADFSGTSIAGHLGLNHAGDRIYVTNRGHDSVAIYAWNDGGMPRLLQHAPSGGASPRAFVLLEAEGLFLLVNEQGANVTVFSIRPDGTLAPCHQDIAVAGAVFLFLPPPPKP